MNNKIIIGVIAVLVIGGGYYFLNQESSVANDVVVEKEVVVEESATNNGDVVEITIEGSPFELAPNSIQAKVGQTVRVTFKNLSGFHDFTIDEFDVATAQIDTGEEEVVEFVVTEAGEFDFYCSVGNHRAQGMEGVLTVTE